MVDLMKGMKTLDHTFHILEKNNIILVPIFFHIILVQTIASYVLKATGIQDPQLLLQNFESIIPKFFWLGLLSGLLILLIDSFFLSMTLSMIFEAWKKGKTKLNLSYGTKFFTKILTARIIYSFILLTLVASLIFPVLLFSRSPILAALFGTGIGLVVILFLLSFFWLNESIVTKKKGILQAFPFSKKTTFKNLSLTIKTILVILAFTFIAQAIVNIFTLANNLFLTTLIVLLTTIFLKALVSILKIVSFLQAK